MFLMSMCVRLGGYPKHGHPHESSSSDVIVALQAPCVGECMRCQLPLFLSRVILTFVRSLLHWLETESAPGRQRVPLLQKVIRIERAIVTVGAFSQSVKLIKMLVEAVEHNWVKRLLVPTAFALSLQNKRQLTLPDVAKPFV